MSRFAHQANAIKQIWDEIRAIKARLGSISTPAGQLRVTSSTLVGGIWAHDHSDAADGGQVEYSPAAPSNWIGNTDPGNAWQALDQLAARIKTLEALAIGIPPVSYPANTMLFNGMEG